MSITEIILNGKVTPVKQVTKWKTLNEDSKLCIVEVRKGEYQGRVLIARKHKQTITSLKDADRAFIEEWYSKSVKIYKLNFKAMSKSETGAKETAPKTAKKGTTAKKGKTTTKAKPAKAAKKAAAPKEKKVGVIASILEFIQAGPVKEKDIIKKLVKRFPEKAEASMTKTVKAQIGSKKRPVRMERERNLTFVIDTDEKSKERTYSIKK